MTLGDVLQSECTKGVTSETELYRMYEHVALLARLNSKLGKRDVRIVAHSLLSNEYRVYCTCAVYEEDSRLVLTFTEIIGYITSRLSDEGISIKLENFQDSLCYCDTAINFEW